MAGRRHEISLQAEQSLIAAAQGGSKRAVAVLLEMDRPFIRSLAAQVCRRVIHRPDVRTDMDDLEMIGVTEYLYKLTRYNAEKSNGCRLRNYAFLDMKHAMQRHACAGLESVPLPNNHKIHAAHRDYEAGMSIEAIIKKHNIPEDAARSLHRGTVSMSKLAEEDSEPPAPLEENDRDDNLKRANRAWELLDGIDRQVLSEMRFEKSQRKRAQLAGRALADQQALERRALRNAQKAMESIDDTESEIDVTQLAMRIDVWVQLEPDEREVVVLHHLGIVNPDQKASIMKIDRKRAIELERQTWTNVRRLASMRC